MLRNLEIHFTTVLQALEEVIQADDLTGNETQQKDDFSLTTSMQNPLLMDSLVSS